MGQAGFHAIEPSVPSLRRDRRYSQAIDTIRITNKDLYQFCVNWLIGANTSDTIPFHIWGIARQGVNAALDVLLPGIAELENML